MEKVAQQRCWHLYYKRLGIKQDFIITFVNNSMVTNPADVAAIVKKAKRSVLVEGVYPDGSVFYYAIGL